MKRNFLWLAGALLILMLVGCGRQASSHSEDAAEAAATDEAASSAAPSEAGAPADLSSAPAEVYVPPSEPAAGAGAVLVQAQEIEGVVHPFMTQQLRQFILETGRMPSDFSEFAGARMDSVPFAPPGTEYVIDPANHSVKIVKIPK